MWYRYGVSQEYLDKRPLLRDPRFRAGAGETASQGLAALPHHDDLLLLRVQCFGGKQQGQANGDDVILGRMLLAQDVFNILQRSSDHQRISLAYQGVAQSHGRTEYRLRPATMLRHSARSLQRLEKQLEPRCGPQALFYLVTYLFSTSSDGGPAL